MHLSKTHKYNIDDHKLYYDKYYKVDGEGLDPFTQEQTEFISITRGYKKYDGSKESNRRKLATSTVDYWVHVHGYSVEEARIFLKELKKEAVVKYKETWSKLKAENPDIVYCGGYTIEKFILDGFSEEEAIKLHEEARARRCLTFKETYKQNPNMFVGKRTGQVEYWINKGYSEEDAKLQVSKSQATFTLEKCIQRYGEIEGTERFNKRQREWSAKMEEKYRNGEYSRHYQHPVESTLASKVELEFIEALINRANLSADSYDTMFNGGNQYAIFSKELGKNLLYDFRLDNKIIEFNGDYWHCNPSKYDPTYFNTSLKCTAQDKWQYDQVKQKIAEDLGFEVLVVWENEWRTSPEQILAKCIQFLNT